MMQQESTRSPRSREASDAHKGARVAMYIAYTHTYQLPREARKRELENVELDGLIESLGCGQLQE